MPKRLLLAVCLAGFVAPAAAGLFGDDEARKRIDEQSKVVQGIGEKVKALQDDLGQLKSLDARVGAVESTVNGGSLLNLLNQIETLTAEIARLRGELEAANNRIDGADRRARDLYMDVDGRLRLLEKPSAAGEGAAAAPAIPDPGLVSAPPPAETLPMPAVSTGALPTPATAPSPTGVPKPATLPAARPGSVGELANESVAYEAAHAARKDGRFVESAKLFQQFIATHPGSALAAPAQYWTGDSLYNAKDYAGAILAQRRLLDTYPGSAKVPDAMLNMASALRDSGDAAGERRMLETLISRHPASEAAEKARKRLAARN
jgi:tol-pal system protein YbgF